MPTLLMACDAGGRGSVTIRSRVRASEGKVHLRLLRPGVRRQEAVGIDRGFADTHFVVQMRSRHASRSATAAHRLALTDFPAGAHLEPREVRVVGLETVPVIDNHQPPVAPFPIGKRYDTVRRGQGRGADWSRNIHARVVSAFTRKGIRALSETAHQYTL